MYFPWPGLLEQVRLADKFVHYDDVQFSRGFFNRVQIKTKDGLRWLTVPLKKHAQIAKINQIEIDESKPWRDAHLRDLLASYRRAPFVDDLIGILDSVYSLHHATLADVSRESILALAGYFGIRDDKLFLKSSDLDVGGHSSERLLSICLGQNETTYITGHGARNYLNHELFESKGVHVRYMDYEMRPYPQLFGEFCPFVSALDLVANCGRRGVEFLCSNHVPWRKFVKGIDHAV